MFLNKTFFFQCFRTPLLPKAIFRTTSSQKEEEKCTGFLSTLDDIGIFESNTDYFRIDKFQGDGVERGLTWVSLLGE